MDVNPILVAGQWQTVDPAAEFFCAVNPATRQPLQERFPISGARVVRQLLEAASAAAKELREVNPDAIAAFLDACANNIERNAAEIVRWAHLETALPEQPRLLNVELPRTTLQLRQAAQAVRERSFCEPVIDTKNNIRTKLGPLGAPVVILGPNNFPLAFNAVMGSDFASAIAAGNPVIAKLHPSHPKTSQLLAEAAFDAVREAGLPLATVQALYQLPSELGLKLVAAEEVGAVGFTGSRSAGLALKAAADAAGKPVYLEMSSINPVFLLPGAVAERGAELAKELFTSCAMGAGQFCTNPGVSVVLAGPESEELLAELRTLFEQTSPGPLLSQQGPKNIRESVAVLTLNGAECLVGGQEVGEGAFAFQNTLLRVSGEQFLQAPEALQTEAFGTVHLMIFADSVSQMVEIARSLEGNLTGCIYSGSQGQDDASYDDIARVLRYKVGRLLNDKAPTGVAVSPAMQHGGPYPSTGHPGFTAVGMPSAIKRFCARHCYDGVRPHRLPEELVDANPRKIWRCVDGDWTQAPISA